MRVYRSLGYLLYVIHPLTVSSAFVSWTLLVRVQKYVQMSALDDKDVPSAEQWQSAVKFMTSAVQKEIKSAEESLDKLVGPTSFSDRWLRWRSQSETEGKRQAISEELIKFLNAEPVSCLDTWCRNHSLVARRCSVFQCATLKNCMRTRLPCII